MTLRNFYRRVAVSALMTIALGVGATSLFSATSHYLFLGHVRDDGPGEIVQRQVERIDFGAFDLLLLGGDYTWLGTGTRETVAYLDAVLNLSSPTTLAALGNHDTSNKSFFTEVTGRPRYYAFETNRITFVVLDTTDDGQNILGGEFQLLQDTVNGLTDSTHLVLVHHHFVWLSDYPPLASLKGSPLIGASSANLSGLNFYSEVYPLLSQARAKGVEVLCLAGDRTGSETEEFYIDHTTADGVRFVGAGLKEELAPDLKTVVVLEHDLEAGTLNCQFKHLSDLPRIPDEPILVTELHYNPPPNQGDGRSFVELFNSGSEPYDLSGAHFTTGIAFTFPDNTVVGPGEYVIVAADAAQYAGLNARVFDYDGVGRPDVGAPIWLRDRRGVEIDYVAYGISSPWPSLPDNQGPSLMLVDPTYDNEPASHWTASDQTDGTPGAVNIVPPVPGPLVIAGDAAVTRWDDVVPQAWYQLEYTPGMSPTAWVPGGSVVQATETTIELNDVGALGSSQRYYRLRRVFQ